MLAAPEALPAAIGLILYVHLGLDPGGAHGVYPDAAPTPLRRQGARQPDEAVLARVVRRPVRDAEKPRHRADVHDAPGALLEHSLAELAAHEEGSGQVHVQDTPPVGERGFLGG